MPHVFWSIPRTNINMVSFQLQSSMQLGCDGSENVQISTFKSSTDLGKLTSMPIVYLEFQATSRNKMDSCTQTVSNQEFSASVSHICSIGNGDSTWITSVTDQPDILETDNLHLPSRENTSQINGHR